MALRSSTTHRKSGPIRSQRRHSIELLEDRRLLTSTPGLPWLENAELTASSDFEAGDHAGKTVAISGDTIVVSSHKDDDGGFDAGAAYVYVRDDGGTPGVPEDDTWQQQAKLTASDASSEDEFGVGVDIEGDTIIVGAYQADEMGNGAAYVFRRSGTTWNQAAKLTASDGAANDRFGALVAIAGDTIVATALRDDDLGVDSGSAYVFVEPAGGWSGNLTETAKLTANDGQAGDRFGRNVDVLGDTILLSADQLGTGKGKAYVFQRDDNGTSADPTDDVWLQDALLTAGDGVAGDEFGNKVALDGTRAVVTAIRDEVNGVVDAGSAYVFQRGANGSWVEEAKLTAHDRSVNDEFGRGVDIEGNTIVVGAWSGEIDVEDAGSVYFFQRQANGTWVEQGEIAATDAGAGDNFGSSKIDLQGDTLVVGDPLHDHNGIDSGGAYVFVKSRKVELFFDSFEAGQWAGNWVEDDQNDWFTSSQRATHGTFSAEVDGRTTDATLTLSNPIDLSIYDSAELTFDWLIESGFDSGEYLALDVSSDGGATWIESALQLNGDSSPENTWHSESVDLAPFTSAEFLVRFRAKANRWNEDANVDNVRITGMQAANANQTPTANAGADHVLSDNDGTGSEVITLNGSGSDPDGTIVAYQWTDGATVLGNTASISPTLPVGNHTLTLTVTDDDGATASDDVVITVVANQGPSADAGADQTVTDGDDSGSETVTLNGSGADSDGTIVSYQWTQGATVLGNSASISPSLSVGAHTLTLTVTDNGGASASDDVVISVAAPVNQDPTANAGADQSLSDNDGTGSETVTLNGSGNDPDGTIAAYQWTEGATLLGNTASISPTLPVGTHTLTLTVTDDDGATASDDVVVTVVANQGPSADAGADQTVTDSDDNGSETVTLIGSGSDSDGSITLGVGTHVLTLTVTDNGGATATDTVTVTIDAAASGPNLSHGQLASVGNTWQTVTLGKTYTSMVVVATARYDDGSGPGAVRVRNATGNSFEVRVDNVGSTAFSGGVHYIAVEEGVYDEPGQYKLEAVKYSESQTSRKSGWVIDTVSQGYQQSYSNPVVVGQVMSANDEDFSMFWASSGSRTSPPTSSALNVGKHVAEDPDTTRADETIGYLVIEASQNGTIEGLPFVAGVGGDSIRGVGNGTYQYSYTAMPNAKTAVLSSAGMDGGDGGWAVLRGSNPLPPAGGTISLSIDEDQLRDSERNHTTEQVAYFVIDPPLQAAEATDRRAVRFARPSFELDAALEDERLATESVVPTQSIEPIRTTPQHAAALSVVDTPSETATSLGLGSFSATELQTLDEFFAAADEFESLLDDDLLDEFV